MRDSADPGRRGPAAAVGVLLILTLAGTLAPLVANDKPILATVNGRLAAPALADLPIAGRWFDTSLARQTAWDLPGPGVRVLLRAPVPYSYRGINLDEVLRPPGRRHLLGTDALGRDLLARLIHGTRPSLWIGLGATGLALLAGGLIGACAGLRGGLVDLLLMRLTDIVACFPPLVLALAFVIASGHSGIAGMMAAIALCRWTGTARFVRAEILRHADSDLWAAARAAGGSLPRVALKHLAPLLLPPLAVIAAFGVAHAIVLESSLSFVGLGVPPPDPSWGLILAESRPTMDAAWWPVVFPSLALVLVLGALCVVAERAAGSSGERETTPL